MVKYNPYILHVPTDLHPFNKLHTTTLKTNTLSFDCPGKSTTMDKPQSLSAIILSIVSIPLRKKRFDPNTKLQQFGDARVLNLSMTTSKDEPTK